MLHVYRYCLADPCLLCASASLTTQALNSSNDGVGSVFAAGRTGNITEIGLNVTAKSGTAPTFRLGIETMVVTRQASGTYLGGGNAYVDFANPSTGWAWRTLGTPAAVTKDTIYAAFLRYLSGTIDGSNNITVQLSTAGLGSTIRLPANITLVDGAWSNSSLGAGFGVKYDDGTVEVGGAPFVSASNNAWNSGSSPVYRGNGWTPQFGGRLNGAWICYRPTDTSDFRLKVFAATTLVATSKTIDIDVEWLNTGAGLAWIPFDPTTFVPGVDLRFVMEPTTVNNGTGGVHLVFNDVASQRAYGNELWGTTGTGTPVWTDYKTGTDNRIYPIFPTLDRIDILGAKRRAA